VALLRVKELAMLYRGISGRSIANVIQLRAMKNRIVKSNCFVAAMPWQISRSLHTADQHENTS